MSSKAVTGMPGGSKSYFVTVFVIWEELLNGNRKIVTNVPLRLGELQKSLDKRGRSDIRVAERIEILQYEDVGEFWRHRGPSVELLRRVTPEQAREGGRPDFAGLDDGGVLYVLDELHEHLNSRQWKDTGPIVLFYIAKHRHLGDDVYWVTQAPKNVDSQWRSVTQEYIYCRNYGMERFGVFNKGRSMEAVAYLEMFTGSQVPQWTKRYTLDREAMNWYFTSVYKGAADKGRALKGLPIWLLFAGLGLAAIAFYFVSGWAVSWFAGGAKIGPSAPAAAHVASVAPSPATLVGVPEVPQRETLVDKARGELAPSVHLLAVPLRFSTADRVLAALQAEGAPSTGVNIVANSANSGVLLQGTDFQAVSVAAERVRQFDVSTAQIAVHCVVARRTLAQGSDVGLFALMEDVSNGSLQTGSSDISLMLSGVVYDLTSGVATFGAGWSARMALQCLTQFVATDSKYDVMSHPVLLVMAGQRAHFTSGREIPVPSSNSTSSGVQTSVDYKQAEFQFEIRPTVTGSGAIQLEILQSNADVIGTALVAGSQVPTLATQSMQTVVTLTQSQLVYLGGIVIETNVDSDHGTPFVRKVPLLNLVFGRKTTQVERSELFIMLTAEVYRPGEGPERVERAIPVKGRNRARAATTGASAGGAAPVSR